MPNTNFLPLQGSLENCYLSYGDMLYPITRRHTQIGQDQYFGVGMGIEKGSMTESSLKAVVIIAELGQALSQDLLYVVMGQERTQTFDLAFTEAELEEVEELIMFRLVAAVLSLQPKDHAWFDIMTVPLTNRVTMYEARAAKIERLSGAQGFDFTAQELLWSGYTVEAERCGGQMPYVTDYKVEGEGGNKEELLRNDKIFTVIPQMALDFGHFGRPVFGSGYQFSLVSEVARVQAYQASLENKAMQLHPMGPHYYCDLERFASNEAVRSVFEKGLLLAGMGPAANAVKLMRDFVSDVLSHPANVDGRFPVFTTSPASIAALGVGNSAAIIAACLRRNANNQQGSAVRGIVNTIAFLPPHNNRLLIKQLSNMVQGFRGLQGTSGVALRTFNNQLKNWLLRRLDWLLAELPMYLRDVHLGHTVALAYGSDVTMSVVSQLGQLSGLMLRIENSGDARLKVLAQAVNDNFMCFDSSVPLNYDLALKVQLFSRALSEQKGVNRFMGDNEEKGSPVSPADLLAREFSAYTGCALQVPSKVDAADIREGQKLNSNAKVYSPTTAIAAPTVFHRPSYQGESPHKSTVPPMGFNTKGNA
jgi:hypothetical protein